ncbi:MmgE/PrpD family protein [bacterium RCC_150]
MSSIEGRAMRNSDVLSDFAGGLEFNRLPPEVIERAKAVIIDTIACIVGGTTSAPARPVIELTSALSGADQASVLGTRIRTGVVDAVYCNTYLADVLDYEDTIVSHPSAATVPASLAIAELAGASGPELIAAVVAGYEVGVRVQRAIMPTYERRLLVQTEYSWLSFAAVSSAARLLGLPQAAWRDAFGYAAQSSPVPGLGSSPTRPMSWIKGNFSGQASVGVRGALLADRGFRTAHDVLESAKGYAAVMGSDSWDPEILTRGLGQTWAILGSQLKPYPCCRFIHPALDAIGMIRRQRAFDPAEVVEVRVHTFDILVDEFDVKHPESVIDGQFSVPFTTALAVLDIPAGIEWWGERDLLHDPQVLEMSTRVRLLRHAESERLEATERRHSATVDIELVDGTVLTARQDTARGGPEAPLSAEEVRAKFINLTAPVLTQARAQAAFESLTNIESVSDVRDVIAMLTPSSSSEALAAT